MGLKLKTPPATIPVSLLEAKAHINVLHEDEDAYIKSLIETATELAEQIMSRQIISATYELTMETLPERLELPRPDLISVTSIEYIPEGGTVLAPLAISYYIVDNTKTPGEVIRHPDMAYPSISRVPNSVKVTFITGYADASSVPAPIKHWILMQVGTWYEHREEVVIGVSSSKVANKYNDMLLNMYRLVRV